MSVRPLLDAEAAAFLTSGVFIFVSSANRAGAPSLSAAIACQLSTDRREVTIYLSSQEGADVLADVEAGAPIAVVLSVPSTFRTLQLKARGARVRSVLTPDDLAVIEENVRLASLDLARIGFGGAYAANAFDEPRERFVAVVFTPTEAFDQTPGPRAGTPLGGST
jgi:hypothetical protein